MIRDVNWKSVMILPAIFVFLYAVTKAASSAITYDEAFTYLNYATNFSFSAVPDMFFNAWANNHWLNTFLIFISQELTGAAYNEFVIRLPNIVAYLLYLLLCYTMWRNSAIPLWCYALMLFCPVLNEFFGLARGYGLSVLFITLAMYFYGKWHAHNHERHGYLSASLLALVVAGLSVTYSVVWLVAFGIVALIILVRGKKRMLQDYLRHQWIAVALTVVGATFILAYQYVSTQDKPVPPGTSNFFVFIRELPLTIIHDVTVATIVISVVFLLYLLSVVVFRARLLKSIFVFPLAVLMMMLLCLSVAGLELPTSRGILIFYIPFLLALAEIAKWWYQEKAASTKRYFAASNGLVFGLSAVLFVAYSSPVSFSAWGESNSVRDLAYSATADAESRKKLIEINDAKDNRWTPLIPFYREQILHKYHIDILAAD